MRVAILIRRFMRAGGGAEGYAVALAREFSTLHDVHVFCQETDEPIQNVRYHRLPYLGTKPRWLNQLVFALTSWYSTRCGFDVVHSHENTWHGNLQTIHVRPLRYNLLHGKTPWQTVFSWLKVCLSVRLITYVLLEKARFNQPSRQRRLVVATSEALRADCLSVYPDAVIDVVTPGVDMPSLQQHQSQAREALGLPVEGQFLLFVANDFARKGLDTLLQVLQELASNIYLVVVGNLLSNNRIYLTLVERYGLANRVFFVGTQSNMSVPYHAADILVHPTLEDSYGMVVLEAMAHGLPTVVSGHPWCGIASQIVDQRDALLLQDPKDEKKLLRAIRSLLTDDSLRSVIKTNGMAFAAERTWTHSNSRYQELMTKLPPKNILMIKSHSLGVGDLLRSTAAWSALHEKFPGTQLHLLFLSKHKGYPTESLIKEHHLLSSAHFVVIREGDPASKKAKRKPWELIRAEVIEIAKSIQPDYVIDFESAGLRTSAVTRAITKVTSSRSLGIAEFWGRSFFYDCTSLSVFKYAKKKKLNLPIEYTERDFVVLDALDISRDHRPINLNVTSAGDLYKNNLRDRIGANKLLIGLNIGCGTDDARERRPQLNQLVEALHQLSLKIKFVLLMTGAPFEKEVNAEFKKMYFETHGDEFQIHDIAGETTLSEMTGAIDLCHMFVSSDSGPYHMAVAMKKPTIAWFVRDEPQAYHAAVWCRCLVRPSTDEFINAAEDLLHH